MPFRLLFQPIAEEALDRLDREDARKLKRVHKCLGLLEANPRHPGLNSHRYEDLDDVHGEKIWESYVENRTPGAYRVFWHYGPESGEITVIAVTPHP